MHILEFLGHHGVKGIVSGADVRKNREWCKPMSSKRITQDGEWIPYGTYRAWIGSWKRLAELIEVNSSYWGHKWADGVGYHKPWIQYKASNGAEKRVYGHETPY